MFFFFSDDKQDTVWPTLYTNYPSKSKITLREAADRTLLVKVDGKRKECFQNEQRTKDCAADDYTFALLTLQRQKSTRACRR